MYVTKNCTAERKIELHYYIKVSHISLHIFKEMCANIKKSFIGLGEKILPALQAVFGVVPGICWSHSCSLGVTVLSVPVTTEITADFIYHIFPCSSFVPWYFSSLSCSFFLMLLSLGISTCMQCLVGCAITSLPVCFWKCHWILA